MSVRTKNRGLVHWVGDCLECNIDLTKKTAKATQTACRNHTDKTGHETTYENGSFSTYEKIKN